MRTSAALKVFSLGSLMSLAVLGFLAPVEIVEAQEVPDAGSLLRDLETLPRGADPTPELGSQLPPPLPDSGQTITLKSVRFENFSPMATEAELQALVQDRIGEELGFNGLSRLADLVTEHLKNKGYFLAFAYLPQQDISDGNLLIRIQPGRIEGGEIDSENLNTDIQNEQTLERILKTINSPLDAEDSDIIRSRRIERGLLLINDFEGINASSSLQRGEEFGTTRIDLDVNATPRYTANAWVDNYGSYYTGDVRANALGNVNNLTGQGDRLKVSLTRSEFLTYGRVDYERPLGYAGLEVGAGVSALEYELGNADINAEGDALNFVADLRYPVIRSRRTNLYTNLEFEHKELEDRLNETPNKDRVYNNLIVSLEGDKVDQLGSGGLTNFTLTLTGGDLDRSGNQDDFKRDKNNAQTHGRFSKVMVSASRIQKVTDSASVLVSANLQSMASRNLDSAEDISISGVNAVRAYAGGDASGDEGWRLTIEPRYDLAGVSAFGGGIQLSAFYDIGRITKIDEERFGAPSNSAGVNAYTLKGAGLGATWRNPEQFSVKTSYAWKIDDQIEERSTVSTDSEGKNRDGQFWLQGIIWF